MWFRLRGAVQKNLHSVKGGGGPCPLRICMILFGKNQKCLECSGTQEYVKINKKL